MDEMVMLDALCGINRYDRQCNHYPGCATLAQQNKGSNFKLILIKGIGT